MNLRRYIQAVLRHKWLIMAAAVVGTGLGLLAARLAPKEYRAQATLWISAPPGRDGDPRPIQTGGLLNQSNAWVDLLRSWTVLDDVVRQRHLYIQPSDPSDSVFFSDFQLAESFHPGGYNLTIGPGGRGYVLKTAEGLVVGRGQLGDSIGADVGFQWAPPAGAIPAGRHIDFTVRVPRDIAVGIVGQMRTQIDIKGGNFMRVQLTQPTARQAAGILNAILDRYVGVAADLKKEKLEELTKILADQLNQAEANLKRSEMALQEFKVHTITLPSDQQSSPVAPGLQVTQEPVFTRFFTLKVDEAQLKQDRAAIDSVMSSGVSIDALQAIPSVAGSATVGSALQDLATRQASLRTLRERYTDENPQVVEAKKQITQLQTEVIPGLLRDLDANLAARQRRVEREIAASSADLQQIPPRMIEEARRQREVSINDALYTTLQQRYSEAQLSEASSTPDVRILDRAAIPQRPVEDTKAKIILMAVAGAVGLAVLGAILRERFDPRLRYPEEITSGLGLPILGGLPVMAQKRGAFSEELVRQAVEAFRTLRMNVENAHGSGPILVTVSSPGSGDGKSVVASNLAVAFADMRYRTLLIDGDIRRGALHRLFEVQRKPGLTDYLSGHASREEVVQSTQYPTLNFVGSGTRRSNGTELLGSKELRDLILWARSEYQVVLMDSPPLGAGADAYMLATTLGNMVLVLRSGTTDRELAEAKLELVHRLPVRMLGAIFNAVPADSAYSYYSYYYLEGYAAELEEAAGESTPVLSPPVAS